MTQNKTTNKQTTTTTTPKALLNLRVIHSYLVPRKYKLLAYGGRELNRNISSRIKWGKKTYCLQTICNI